MSSRTKVRKERGLMAKAGMKRPRAEEVLGRKIPKNDVKPVPELQGKAKHTKKKARPMLYY